MSPPLLVASVGYASTGIYFDWACSRYAWARTSCAWTGLQLFVESRFIFTRIGKKKGEEKKSPLHKKKIDGTNLAVDKHSSMHGVRSSASVRNLQDKHAILAGGVDPASGL